MDHPVYESLALLPLTLCVKFEWSIIKECKIFKEVWNYKFGCASWSRPSCGHPVHWVGVVSSRDQKFRGHDRTTPGNMHVKFYVCSFSPFGDINM